MKHLRIVGVVLLVMFVVMACAKAPQQAIDAAKAALDEAKQVEADRYAADQFNAAKDSLDAALAEVEKQNAKFAWFRSYGKAEKLLASVTTLAQAAKEAAVANKEKMKVEAEGLLQQADTAIKETEKLLKKAPTGKEGKAALESIKSDLETVKATLTAANDAMSKGDYLTARDKAQSCIQKANDLSNELNEAIQKKAALSRTK